MVSAAEIYYIENTRKDIRSEIRIIVTKLIRL